MSKFDTRLMQVQAMVKTDKARSKIKGHKKIQFRKETKQAVVELTKASPMTYVALAECLAIQAQHIHTWRYLFDATPKTKTPKKVTPKQTSVVERLTAELEQHKQQMERLSKQIEVIKLAESLDLKVEFK